MTWTEKNAAVAGAFALTTCTVVTSPAAVATCGPKVFERFVPAALYQLTATPTAPSAAGVYTSAAAETRSPGRTGWPLVPPGLVPCHDPAPPAAVVSSEGAPSGGQTGGMSGRGPR